MDTTMINGSPTERISKNRPHHAVHLAKPGEKGGGGCASQTKAAMWSDAQTFVDSILMAKKPIQKGPIVRLQT
jgi:hypothetical protein